MRKCALRNIPVTVHEPDPRRNGRPPGGRSKTGRPAFGAARQELGASTIAVMTDAARRPNPTPEQLEKRRRLAEARERMLGRKRRTRRLIQVGGVMAAFGIDTPQQAERLMETLVDLGRPEWRRYLSETLGAEQPERWP